MKNIFKRMFGFMMACGAVAGLASCGISTIETSKAPSSSSATPSSEKPAESTKPKDTDYLAIHYYRYDNSYDNWALWLWEYPSGSGKEVTFAETDNFGGVAKIALVDYGKCLTSGLGIIVKSKGSWNAKDPDGDRVIKFSDLNPKDENKTYHVYLKTEDDKIYTDQSQIQLDDILTCKFNSADKILFTTSGLITSYKVYKNEEVIYTGEGSSSLKNYTYEFEDASAVDLTSNYYVEVVHASGTITKKAVDISSLYNTQAFSDQFNYEGKDLGANYTKEKTTFKVWSPISSSITLRLYDTGTPLSLGNNGSDTPTSEVTMTRGAKGVWEATVNGDLEGKYYTYVVTNAKFTEKEIVDPYAKSTGINGLRGMIVDFSKTNPENWSSVSQLPIAYNNLTVYECHIADLTSSATWGGTAANAKKFNGFYETGTTYTQGEKTVTTGFDHLKELGVNAVQLLPIFDQKNDERAENATFNWGYNPLNYNSLDGIYSSNPYDGYTKIIEFKKLVQAYNEAGIAIIMDVVYNHVADASGSNFDVLAPGYYYRYSGGNLSNGSGCGNETASDMYMYRKFMIESTEFWASEYKLNGFRFDLMGLHDTTTMKQLSTNLKTNVDSSIVVYGEPWTGGSSPLNGAVACTQSNITKFDGYGCFDDKIRDSLIKGGLSAKTDKGWIDDSMKYDANNTANIAAALSGRGRITSQTVNYATCHDNYTLYDRFVAAGISDTGAIRKMCMLTNSIVFSSQGISFMLSGEEFLRTKGGESNSYQSSYKVNELDYSLKVKYNTVFEVYKKLIALRKTTDLFGKTSEECKNIQVNVSTEGGLITFELTDTISNRIYKFAFSNGLSGSKTVDFSGYTLYLDSFNNPNLNLTATTNLSIYQVVIAYKQL